MPTANVYMFNQTNLTANIVINNGVSTPVSGTSDSTGWMPQSSQQTYRTPGTAPGQFNLGKNTVFIALGTNSFYAYEIDIQNPNPGSIEIHIFFYDAYQTYAGLIVLYEGGPTAGNLTVVTPRPREHKQPSF